ncbi:MAG: HAD family hydrolase [Lachnospiraceae bacterium]|jgi:HAD superfamily hydrolase (TIGR01509 family)
MTGNKIKAVIFDMDGVLIDSEMLYLEDLLKFVQTKNPEVTKEDLFSVVGSTAKDTWTIVQNAAANGQDWESLREEYREKRTIYETIDYRSIFRKEAKDLIAYLKENGYRLAVASATKLPLVIRVLTENGIVDYFDQVVSGNMFERGKPDPEIYFYTAGKLGVKPEECLVVEDSTIGITAASRAGMKIAAVIDDRFGFDRSLADFEIENLGEVLECLKKLEESQ